MDTNNKVPLKSVNRDLKSKSALPKPSFLKPPTPVTKKRPASSPEKVSEQASKRPKVSAFTGVNGVSKPAGNSGMTRSVSGSKLNGTTTENARTNAPVRGLVKAPSVSSLNTTSKVNLPPSGPKTNGLQKPKPNVNGQRNPSTARSKIMGPSVKKNINVIKKPPTKEEIIAKMHVENSDLRDKTQNLELNIDELNSIKSKILDDLATEKELSAKFAKQLENLKELNRQMEKSLENTQQDLSMEKVAKRNVEYELSSERDVNQKLNGKIVNLETDISDLKHNLMRTEKDLSEEKETRQELQVNLNTECETNKGLNNRLNELKKTTTDLEQEFICTKKNLDEEKMERKRLQLDLNTESEINRNMSAQNRELQKCLSELENTLISTRAEHEAERRILHNTIQELKGNIRVFCRVRPLIQKEVDVTGGTIHHLTFPENKCIEVHKLDNVSLNESTVNNKNKYTFNFDNVFDPANTQEKVFYEVSQLVQSSLDGYNVCIFAYGQTGSGKTYTMEGGNNNETMGIIPRSMVQIFEAVEPLKSRGWNYEFIASMLEIYNETVQDLLAENDSNLKYEIKMTSKEEGGVYVTNLKTFPVNCQDEVHKLLRLANSKRSVAETKCNARSSRSHSVFQLRIKGNNKITHESCAGTLNLIDLAGSERLKLSGSEGQRLKETQAINTSLANLGNVIMALANKDSHIPYRNSKLTYLLQNSLGGNSKTLMFVNISPNEDSFNETLNSLRFAAKVNSCHIGTATKRTK